MTPLRAEVIAPADRVHQFGLRIVHSAPKKRLWCQQASRLPSKTPYFQTGNLHFRDGNTVSANGIPVSGPGIGVSALGFADSDPGNGNSDPGVVNSALGNGDSDPGFAVSQWEKGVSEPGSGVSGLGDGISELNVRFSQFMSGFVSSFPLHRSPQAADKGAVLKH